MQQPLVTRPAYGEAPVAESKLPSGTPGGKGLPLDDSIPGAATHAKPEEDIRHDAPGDGSMYRVDGPGDIAKDQTTPDGRDLGDLKPGYAPPGQDTTPKTRYPYRDGIPNAHNARTTMGPKDVAKALRPLIASLEAPKGPDREAVAKTLRGILVAMTRKGLDKTADTGIYKRTVKEMALELLATDDDDKSRVVAVTADLLEALGLVLYKMHYREAARYVKQAENALLSDPQYTSQG